jgi:hypothetical protein
MNDFSTHWNKILTGDEKNQVDVIVSLHEDGINHFLSKHFEIDRTLPAEERKYLQVFERVFQTFGDKRSFKITLSLTEAIKIKLPPFTDGKSLSPSFKKTSGWEAIHYPNDGPELIGSNSAGENLIEMVAPGITVTMEWPKLDGTIPPWTFVIPPFEVIAQAELQLYQEEQDFFVKMIPKFILFDIPRHNLQTLLQNQVRSADSEFQLMLTECEEKFIDLFIIAANIAAYEQTPKLVTSIKLPVPVIKERPIQPAAFDISNDILTVGFGIDKVLLDNFNTNLLKSKSQELEVAIATDIERANGLLNIVYKNAEGKKLKTPNQLIARPDEEIDTLLSHTNAFIKKQEAYLKTFEEEETVVAGIDKLDYASEAFAIGINEYFFDVIVNSALPQPKHRCENDVELGLVKGYICHWSAFSNPDVSISSSAVLSGAVDINIGGSIHACVKKFWDCSWKWACAKLALALVGRPKISLTLLSADGIKLLAQLSGDVRIASNLPYPFNKVVEALSKLVIKFIMAFINLLAVILTFFVLKPKIDLEDLHLRLTLKDFSRFYFQRTGNTSGIPTKNKFVCFKTNVSVTKI